MFELYLEEFKNVTKTTVGSFLKKTCSKGLTYMKIYPKYFFFKWMCQEFLKTSYQVMIASQPNVKEYLMDNPSIDVAIA